MSSTIKDNLLTIVGQRIDNAWDMTRTTLSVADVVGYIRVELAHEGGERIAEDVRDFCEGEVHPVFSNWVDPTINMYPSESFRQCLDALDEILADHRG